MTFSAYNFKEAVRSFMPYGEQWQNEESREAKLMNAIGQAISSQICQFDFVEESDKFKNICNGAISQVQNIYSSIDFTKEHELAKNIADEKRNELLHTFKAEIEVVEKRLKQELIQERELFETRMKVFSEELKKSFMEELRALK